MRERREKGGGSNSAFTLLYWRVTLKVRRDRIGRDLSLRELQRGRGFESLIISLSLSEPVASFALSLFSSVNSVFAYRPPASIPAGH